MKPHYKVNMISYDVCSDLQLGKRRVSGAGNARENRTCPRVYRDLARTERGPLKECTLAWAEAPFCRELAAAVVITGT